MNKEMRNQLNQLVKEVNDLDRNDEFGYDEGNVRKVIRRVRHIEELITKKIKGGGNNED